MGTGAVGDDRWVADGRRWLGALIDEPLLALTMLWKWDLEREVDAAVLMVIASSLVFGPEYQANPADRAVLRWAPGPGHGGADPHPAPRVRDQAQGQGHRRPAVQAHPSGGGLAPRPGPRRARRPHHRSGAGLEARPAPPDGRRARPARAPRPDHRPRRPTTTRSSPNSVPSSPPPEEQPHAPRPHHRTQSEPLAGRAAAYVSAPGLAPPAPRRDGCDRRADSRSHRGSRGRPCVGIYLGDVQRPHPDPHDHRRCQLRGDLPERQRGASPAATRSPRWPAQTCSTSRERRWRGPGSSGWIR